MQNRSNLTTRERTVSGSSFTNEILMETPCQKQAAHSKLVMETPCQKSAANSKLMIETPCQKQAGNSKLSKIEEDFDRLDLGKYTLTPQVLYNFMYVIRISNPRGYTTDAIKNLSIHNKFNMSYLHC